MFLSIIEIMMKTPELNFVIKVFLFITISFSTGSLVAAGNQSIEDSLNVKEVFDLGTNWTTSSWVMERGGFSETVVEEYLGEFRVYGLVEIRVHTWGNFGTRGYRCLIAMNGGSSKIVEQTDEFPGTHHTFEFLSQAKPDDWTRRALFIRYDRSSAPSQGSNSLSVSIRTSQHVFGTSHDTVPTWADISSATVISADDALTRRAGKLLIPQMGNLSMGEFTEGDTPGNQ